MPTVRREHLSSQRSQDERKIRLFTLHTLAPSGMRPPFMCASVYELCERMAPGFVKDVASWLGLTLWGGLVIQVKKRRRSDEGMQRNLLTAIMGLYRGMRLVVVVDEDIDPWQPEDVMWAIQSRALSTKGLYSL
ncbi:MAG: hypothetical protein ACJ0HT_01420 [Alphaproteobacteria bacterium]